MGRAALPLPPPPTTTVTFYVDGVQTQQSLKYGDELAEPTPAPEKTGYTFIGWYDNADFTGDAITFPVTVNSELTYYAKFAPIEQPKPGPDAVESALLANVSIYPNPVEDRLTLRADAPIVRYAIYTVYGAKIEEVKVGTPIVAIDVSRSASGVYYIRLTDELGEQVTRRFVRR